MGEVKNTFAILIEKLEGKTLLGKSRRGWEDNIKTDFKEISYEFVG
jgi:hypothetical protein